MRAQTRSPQPHPNRSKKATDTHHLVRLVELHLDPAESSFPLLTLDILGVALELLPDAVDDLLEVLLVRVEECRR